MNTERLPISEPGGVLPPILEPGFYESAEFSFRPAVRDWWMRVANYRCQYEYYESERYGWQQCSKKAEHVHHIRGEAETLINGDDPNKNVGMPLCVGHHAKNRGDEEHSKGFSFHPDMGEAYKHYREWKAKEQHMKEIGNRRSIDYKTSPFAETARDHQEKARRGERYIAGTEQTDEYYIDKMTTMAMRYQIQHPEDPYPVKSSPHPLTDKSQKHHWSDGLFDEPKSSGVTTTTRKPSWFRRR